MLSAHALPFVPRLAEPSAELPAGLSPAPTLIQGGLLPATLPPGLPLTACAPPFAQSSASDFERRPTVRPDSHLADGALPSLPNPPQTLHSFWHPAPTLSPDPIARTFDFTLESPAYCAPLLSEPLLQTHSFMLPAFNPDPSSVQPVWHHDRYSACSGTSPAAWQQLPEPPGVFFNSGFARLGDRSLDVPAALFDLRSADPRSEPTAAVHAARTAAPLVHRLASTPCVPIPHSPAPSDRTGDDETMHSPWQAEPLSHALEADCTANAHLAGLLRPPPGLPGPPPAGLPLHASWANTTGMLTAGCSGPDYIDHLLGHPENTLYATSHTGGASNATRHEPDERQALKRQDVVTVSRDRSVFSCPPQTLPSNPMRSASQLNPHASEFVPNPATVTVVHPTRPGPKSRDRQTQHEYITSSEPVDARVGSQAVDPGAMHTFIEAPLEANLGRNTLKAPHRKKKLRKAAHEASQTGFSIYR